MSIPELMKVRHQVAIAGRVTDALTRRPLGGALVNIVEMPAAAKRRLAMKSIQYGGLWNSMAERVDRTRTADDGLFYFLDLPDGEYTITASIERFGKRYGSAQGTFTVSRDATGKMQVGPFEISLPATTVRGKVTGPELVDGVSMAEVRVRGSGERAFSDRQGRYVLAGVEPGERTLVVTARGYASARTKVTLEKPGELATMDIALGLLR